MDHHVNANLWRVLRVFLASLGSTILLLLLVSILLWTTDLTERYMEYYALGCCIPGAILSGWGGGKIGNRRGVFWGAIFGLFYLFLLYLLIQLSVGSTGFSGVFHVKWLVCFGLSALAGMLSVNLRKK